jgi:hypothetical protein
MEKVKLSDLISSLKGHFVVKKYWDRQDLNPGRFDYECSICGASGWETHDSQCFVRLAEVWLEQNDGYESVSDIK